MVFLLLALQFAIAADPAARAQAALQAQHYRLAQARFERLAAEHPDEPAYHLGLARSLAAVHRCSRALSLFERYEAAPEFEARDGLAASNCALSLGHRALAASHLDDTLRFHPDQPGLLFEQAWLAASLGDVDLFEDRAARFVEAGGEPGRLYVLQALMALSRGEVFEARRHLDTADDLGVEGPGREEIEARVLLAEGEPGLAAELLAPRLRERPDDVEMACWLAEARRRSGSPERGALVLSTPRRREFEALCREVVLVRIFVDLGQAVDPAPLLAAHPFDPQVLASAWYVSRGTAEAEHLRERYEQVAGDEPLDHLLPGDAP